MLDIKKCIWLTGASTGIGKSLALKLANEGFVVAASARSVKNLKKLEEESKSLKGSIKSYPLDISSQEKTILTFKNGSLQGPITKWFQDGQVKEESFPSSITNTT